MDSTDVLFIFPPGGSYEFGHFSYALGSGYVIAYLREKAVSASQFFSATSLTAREAAIQILQRKPKLIGFTVFNTNFASCVLIAQQIKALSPEPIIVFGGPTASNYAPFIIQHYPSVDICLRNEGEEICFALYCRLQESDFQPGRARLEDLPSLTFLKDGRLCHTPPAQILILNARVANYLDNYPSPYLTGVIPAEAAATIGMITARGCNQNCTYCNCAVLSNRRFQMHSTDRVIAEIDYLSQYLQSNQVLNIFDDAFTLIPTRAKALCRLIIDRKITVNLGCITRCDLVDNELLELMKAAGFVSVGFALESAVPRILRIIGKVKPAQDIPTDDLARERKFIKKLDEVTTYAKALGIKTVYSSIMVGLPTETIEEANHTIDVIDGFKNIDTYTHNFLTIYHGTPLYDKHACYNYKIEQAGHIPIFGMTRYPDKRILRHVRVSPKSQIHNSRQRYDQQTIRILAMLPQRVSAARHFDSVILLLDVLSKPIVQWMQKAVAVNAPVIHLYSSRQRYIRHAEENGKRLLRFFSPTLNVHNYFAVSKNAHKELISSYTVLIRDENVYSNLRQDTTRDLLRQYETGSDIRFTRSVCCDETLDDAATLIRELRRLQGFAEPFDHLASSRPLPYFAGLCKWLGGGANCETFETAIVDQKGQIRLCWKGEPVGDVCDSVDEIIERVSLLRRSMDRSRGCEVCAERERCMKCPYPAPLSVEDYCANISFGLVKEAGLLRAFNMLNEYVDA